MILDIDYKTPASILDACVLYKAPLRDLLLHLAIPSHGLYRACWTEQIQKEWTINLLANRPDLKSASLERTLEEMRKSFPASIIEAYARWVEKIKLEDANDRHVVAAAIEAEANYIITFNLKDFPENVLSPYDIIAIHPDDFISELIEQDKIAVCSAVKRQRSYLKNPPKSAEELLAILQKQGLTQTVSKLTNAIDLI